MFRDATRTEAEARFQESGSGLTRLVLLLLAETTPLLRRRSTLGPSATNLEWMPPFGSKESSTSTLLYSNERRSRSGSTSSSEPKYLTSLTILSSVRRTEQ